MVYSAETEGYSTTRFIQAASRYDSTMVVFRTLGMQVSFFFFPFPASSKIVSKVFGAFFDVRWVQNAPSFTGSPNCFLFSLTPPVKYAWKGPSSSILHVSTNSFEIGAGKYEISCFNAHSNRDGMALLVSQDFKTLNSCPCDIFGSPSLNGSDESFELSAIELWIFE